jgi:DNA polymerase III delta prime subunit
VHLVRLLVILIASVTFSYSQAKEDNALLGAYLSDAKISTSTADLYRSYKLYLYLYENHRDYFFDKAASSYITTIRELASAPRLKQVCNVLVSNKKFSDKIRYRCAYEMFNIGSYQEARNHLKAISAKSKEYLLAQILLASISLSEEDHKSCLNILTDKNRPAYEENKISDIFYITKARCQAKAKLYGESIVSYQSVSAKSRYYFEALTELSWVFFKVRDVELVRNSVKAIQASYKQDVTEASSQHATIGQYYFSKYLLSYIDLVVYGNTQKDKFATLDKELDTYLKKEFITRENVKSALKDIEKATSYSELKMKSKNYQKMIYHFSQWLPYENITTLNNNIRLLIAVNKENQRFATKVYSKQDLAMRAMRVLKSKMDTDIKLSLATMLDTSLRVVNGFRLKIKIGEVDLKNLSRTEGLKNLDEATTIYKEKENSLSQKMGLEI